MSLLEFFFIISGFIILILGIDVARRQKFNALHFLVFISIGSGLLVFTFFPEVLTRVGNLFGLQRGADLLVYSSIIFLIYITLLLLRKTEENITNLTRLVREIGLENTSKEKKQYEILILMRAYNEGKVIFNTLNQLINAGYKDILIVNDGSKDNTGEEIKKLQSIANIILITHNINRGGGAALETGFEYIRRYVNAKYVVTFDADGQHDVNDILQVHTYFQKNKVDVLLGSRFLGKEATGMPFMRRVILKLGIIFTIILSNVRLSDAHNGFRVFRPEVIKKIHLTIDGMGYASELIDTIATKKIPYMEIPVNIRYSKYSLLKGQKSSNAINIALEFIWNKFFK